MVDAVELPYGELRPAPDKVVANLPYGIAATVILKSIAELPGARRWVAMVQREVAERLAASPGTRTYGASSAIAQLSCAVRVARRVAPTVFTPVPRVESALCVLERTDAPPAPGVAMVIHAAFAHRRKTLAGSLALVAGPDLAGEVRARAQAALGELGHRPDARAERVAPAELAALADRLGPDLVSALTDRAPGRR
jgi:16S rRNA (adenine1518-N6/adenine1519-N6)-dimethyltransferase